jgi:ribonuclease M5
MKIVIPAIIVVEGTTDANFLNSFLDAEIVITNGSDVPRETIDYLREAIKTKPVIIMTDPDGPGQKIRHKLDQSIPGLKHAFVPKEEAIAKGKVGIAQASEATIIKALEMPIETKAVTLGTLTSFEMMSLGLVAGPRASTRRDFIARRFHLGHNNGKQMLRRLNNLNIGKEDLAQALKEYEQNPE